MPTSLVRNGDKGIWVHDAIGETWLAALNGKLLELPQLSLELIDLSHEIEQGLAHGWIVGALMYDFSSLLRQPEIAACLESIQKQIEADWKLQATSSEFVRQGAFCVDSMAAVAEMEMLNRLFFDASSIPMPPHYFNLATSSWKVA